MINQNKWINSLPRSNSQFNEKSNQIDHDVWINTIPKKNSFISAKKYSLLAIFFICGLLFVSAVKNETRNLQKEINNLITSINLVQFNLDQAILDNEVITSPENIASLAKQHLNDEFFAYKKSQIKSLDGKNEKFTNINEIKQYENIDKNSKDLSGRVKLEVAERIKQKKAEIKKLKEFYDDPKLIPKEIKVLI